MKLRDSMHIERLARGLAELIITTAGTGLPSDCRADVEREVDELVDDLEAALLEHRHPTRDEFGGAAHTGLGRKEAP